MKLNQALFGHNAWPAFCVFWFKPYVKLIRLRRGASESQESAALSVLNFAFPPCHSGVTASYD